MPEGEPDQITTRLEIMTEWLLRSGAIRSPQVADAFRTIPRHVFIHAYYPTRHTRVEVPQDRLPEPEILDAIYSQRSLVTHPPATDSGTGMSSSSEPALMARMLEALDLRSGHKVLEIGAGTGYNAALIHTITQSTVITVDPTPGVADQAASSIARLGLANAITVLPHDGYHGHPDRAPYDRIVATVGIGAIPATWLNQLADGGIILAPIYHGGIHPTISIRRTADAHLAAAGAVHSDFMPAAGPLHPHYRPPRPMTFEGQPTVRPHPFPTLNDEPYADLWFALATQDHRINRQPVRDLAAGGQCALTDPTQGTVLIQHDALRSLDANTTLTEQAETLITAWANQGHPALTDWHAPLRPYPKQLMYRPTQWTTRYG